MAATGFFSAIAAGALICVLGQVFLEPLATLLGSTPTILPYTKAYLRVILLGAPWMTSSLVLNNQLRYQGSAAYAMVGIASGAVLNIALDPLLIFGLGHHHQPIRQLLPAADRLLPGRQPAHPHLPGPANVGLLRDDR